LQIIIFSIFFGAALRSIKDTNSDLIKIMESITNVVMKMVFILINFAPFGVFCLMAALF
jgi:Na+/H+-dicarboxylate symporter